MSDVPLTDIPPDSLVDTDTPLESQPDTQNTFETKQQHAAVYSPAVNEAPEQTPDQIAAVSGPNSISHGKAPGEDQWLSKHAKRDKQQDELAAVHSKGTIFTAALSQHLVPIQGQSAIVLQLQLACMM